MLVLTRKSNQSIMIGDDVEVSVLSVMGEKVRIGIQAPQEIPVFRKEIYLEIHREDAHARGSRGRGARTEVNERSVPRADALTDDAERRRGGDGRASRSAHPARPHARELPVPEGVRRRVWQPPSGEFSWQLGSRGLLSYRSRYSVRNITTVTIAAVRINVSTSSTKRTEPRL